MNQAIHDKQAKTLQEVQAIMSELGPEWYVHKLPDPRSAHTHMQISNGNLTLSIGADNYQTGANRFEISAYFPDTSFLAYDERRASIKVSRTRSPKALAADIQKRLIPTAEEQMARYRAHAKQEQEAEQAREDAMTQLEQVGCERLISIKDSLYGPKLANGTFISMIRVNYNATINMDLQSLTPAQAKAVIEALK